MPIEEAKSFIDFRHYSNIIQKQMEYLNLFNLFLPRINLVRNSLLQMYFYIKTNTYVMM